MNDVYLTRDQAEEIIMAVEVGMYNIDAPGARSKLAHARLLISSQQPPPQCSKCQDTDWVCENHPDVPWNEGEGCSCGGAGMPCVCG